MQPQVTCLSQLPKAPTKIEDDKAKVQNPLLEVNLGTTKDSRLVFINVLLKVYVKKELIELLTSYKDCFIQGNHEFPSLDRDLEHYLPIKPNFLPYQQPRRRMAHDVISKVKVEIQGLLKVKFIRIAKYVTWLLNIVLVIKKNGKMHIHIDFRNLNNAMPKDKYPMLMADMLIDLAIRNTILISQRAFRLQSDLYY